jgi:hypothetical protein
MFPFLKYRIKHFTFDEISAQVFVSFKVRDKMLAELQFSQLADILSSAPQN